ncbi:MAG: TonB-dependent receptor plug domain-containing protein [Gammaproteobacteria bacterium]
MFPNRIIRRRVAASVFCAACLPMSSYADDVLEEIIVTADFRERAIADVPASITVLAGEQIKQLAVQHLEELVSVVPNLNWSGDGHRARYFQIRGVGELEQYEGAPNPSVGFLIDDIDFSGIGTIATLFDIQQIEVLRGPQGSRYGANALAGLIYVQSAEPTAEWSGQLQLGAAQDDAVSGGIAFGGPVAQSDALRYRLSGHIFESNGFRNNPYLNRSDTNGRKESSMRGKLLWEKSNNWTIKLTAMFTDIDDGYDAFAIDNSLTVLSDKPGRDTQRSLGSSLKAMWGGAGTYEFTSITSAASSDIDFSFDADWGNDDAWAPITYDYISENDRRRKTFSQEFRLGSADGGRIFNESADWLVGVYVLRLEDEIATNNQGEYFDPGFNFADSLDEQFASSFEALNTALFGQLDTDVGEAGLLGLGIRIENRSTDYSDSAGMVLGPGETMVGGELSYNHSFTDDLTGFVAVSKGYKAGGFNLGAVPDESQRQYGQEHLWNLEAGIRSSWLNNSLAISASIFYSRRRDQQVRTSLQLVPGDPASFIFFTDNAAKGRTLGIEADLRWLPNDAWEMYSNVGLLNAEFEEFMTLQVGDTELSDLSRRDQAHAPKYTLALGGIYRHSSGAFARLDFSARDDFFFDVSHNQKSSAYQLVNARVGFESVRWTTQLWVRNLFDERYAVRGFYFGNEPPLFPNTLYVRQGDPRQVGITFDMRF